jgi:hypothetical protein
VADLVVATVTARPVQTSLIEGMERPIGPLPLSVQTGTNADLMFAIKDLYLTGSVLDVTYGEGKWWDRVKPDPFTAHDLYKLDGVNFRALPEATSSIETVCFDPPYVISGGKSSSTAGTFQDNYGIGDASADDLYALWWQGLAECIRVSRQWVLVKCMEFAQGGRFHDVPAWMKQCAQADPTNRATVHDVIVHNTGTGPGGHNIWEAKRCRRAHSYLLVFEVPR